MSDRIELLIASSPERDFLTCEILQGGQVFAEVRIESSGLAIELRPKHDGSAWDVPFDDLLAALIESKVILSGVDTSVTV